MRKSDLKEWETKKVVAWDINFKVSHSYIYRFIRKSCLNFGNKLSGKQIFGRNSRGVKKFKRGKEIREIQRFL